MKWTRAAIVAICLGLVTVPMLIGSAGAAEAESAPPTIEVRLERVWAEEALEVNATLTVGNETYAEHVVAATGEEVAVGHHFTNVTGEWRNQSVRLVADNGATVFGAETRLEDGRLRLVNATYDRDRVHLVPEEQSLMVATGNVDGRFEVQVEFVSDAAASGTVLELAVDEDGDGAVGDPARFPAEERTVNATLPIEAAPGTSAWELRVIANQTAVASWSGSWDWLRGAPAVIDQRLPERDRVFEQVHAVRFTPERDSVKGLYTLPNVVFTRSAPEAMLHQDDLATQTWTATFGPAPDSSTDPATGEQTTEVSGVPPVPPFTWAEQYPGLTVAGVLGLGAGMILLSAVYASGPGAAVRSEEADDGIEEIIVEFGEDKQGP